MSIEELAAFLCNRFGGLDFWILSKPWKEKYYIQTAKLLWQDHILYRGRIKQLEQYIRDNGLSIPEYEMSVSEDITW